MSADASQPPTGGTPAGLGLHRALAGVLTYPDRAYRMRVASCVEAVADECGGSTLAAMQRFMTWVAQQPLAALEEAFTQTFDLNPQCSLEVGWHLFGEEYDRGAFMAEVRGRLRDLGVEERTELPDHMTHVLPMMAAMPDDEASWFGAKMMLPALDLMIGALEKVKSPYIDVLRVVRDVTGERVSAEDIAAAESEAESSAAPEFWTGEMPPEGPLKPGEGGAHKKWGGSRYVPPGMDDPMPGRGSGGAGLGSGYAGRRNGNGNGNGADPESFGGAMGGFDAMGFAGDGFDGGADGFGVGGFEDVPAPFAPGAVAGAPVSFGAGGCSGFRPRDIGVADPTATHPSTAHPDSIHMATAHPDSIRMATAHPDSIDMTSTHPAGEGPAGIDQIEVTND